MRKAFWNLFVIQLKPSCQIPAMQVFSKLQSNEMGWQNQDKHFENSPQMKKQYK